MTPQELLVHRQQNADRISVLHHIKQLKNISEYQSASIEEKNEMETRKRTKVMTMKSKFVLFYQTNPKKIVNIRKSRIRTMKVMGFKRVIMR